MRLIASKTKKSKNTKKKSNKASSENTTATAYEKEPKKKSAEKHRRRDTDAGSKEQPSTANSKMSRREKPRSKNKKKKKNGDTSIEQADEMLKALAEKPETPPDALRTPPGPPNHSSPAHIKKSKEEEQKPAHPPICILPPPPVDATSPKPNAPVRSPAPDHSLKIHSTVTPSSTLSTTDKWCGEDSGKAWLEKADFGKTKSEFERIQMMTVNADNECKKWKANRTLNQSTDDYPALDSNLTTFENVYVNMSLVQVPLQQNIYMGQMPVKGNEESFWKVIFDKRITFIEIITDQEPVDFFPNRCGSHVYHGTMFVNNRKVETASEDVHRFLIEVLPEGCSNSIMCNITVIKNWNFESVYAKQAVVIKDTIELLSFMLTKKDESALVVSKHGAGRAGYFVALSVAVFQLNRAEEPSIFEIVKSLRSQRPKSVESLTQYVSLYTSLFYYIKKKVAKIDVHRKAIHNPNCPITKKAVQLTQLFTSALLAEVNGAAGMSTMTMIK